MKYWLLLQRSLLSTVTYSSRQLDKWHWIDFAYLRKLLTARITMKISDNLSLLQNVFVSHCRRDSGYPVGKKNCFQSLKFYILLYLRKNISVWSFPLWKKQPTLCLHTHVQFMLARWATCDKNAPHSTLAVWLTLRLPGIQPICRSKY